MKNNDETIGDLTAFVGEQAGPYRAWDRVNASMIRHWCDAIEDQNPIYIDTEAAMGAGYSGVVAPPAMLQAWNMPGYIGKHAPGSTDRNPMRVLDVLETAGYPAIVAVNCEQEYHRYLVEDDDIYHTSTIESISDRKTTALGVGYFITQCLSYFDQRDELVATMKFRVFKYRPHAAGDAEQ